MRLEGLCTQYFAMVYNILFFLIPAQILERGV